MKRLTLYIDKWYIIGAVCTDGIPHLISPSNKEDRFWLYFYEDVVNDEVVYGKENQRHFRNNEPHYYGNVFSLITDKTNTFVRYGRKQDIHQIFKASGIIQKIKEAVGVSENEKIETYLSFSNDITDGARLIFIRDVMLPDNFDIKESVARIGHLALEHSIRNGGLSNEGFYIVLNACNENLNYSIYIYKDGLFLRKNEASLIGMGADLRCRALLENVVRSINKTQHILYTDSDYENEYLRLSQFVDDWIVRLENAKPGRPIIIPNITFSSLPNTYSATVIKKEIDDRTHSIVDDIVREITTFVKNTGLTNEQINGVVFIGNTFSNKQFVSTLKEHYSLDNDKYIFYRDVDLPDIIGVYSVIDCAQFKGDTNNLFANGETEIERINLAKEEEKKQREAERLQQEKDDENKKAREAELRYKEAMDNIADYEKRQDYAQMKDWAEIALNHKPDDEEAKQKLADATRLLSDKKVRDEQYKNTIQRAIESLNNKKWQDALSQSEAALTIYAHSAEAKRIHEEARKRLDDITQMDKFLARADLFIAQKLYAQAMGELKKVRSFDSHNDDVEERIKRIDIEIQKQKEILLLEEGKLNDYLSTKDYGGAIKQCDILIEVCAENDKIKWASRKVEIKNQQEKELLNREKINGIRGRIDIALKNEDWERVVILCDEVLCIDNTDSLVISILNNARKNIEKVRYQQPFDNAYEAKDWEEVIRLFDLYTILKDNDTNRRKKDYAKRQIIIGRKKESANKSKLGPKNLHNKNGQGISKASLLPDSIPNIEIGKKNKFRPPQRRLEIENENGVSENVNCNVEQSARVIGEEHTSIKSNKSVEVNEKRKFPKVKRNK